MSKMLLMFSCWSADRSNGRIGEPGGDFADDFCVGTLMKSAVFFRLVVLGALEAKIPTSTTP